MFEFSKNWVKSEASLASKPAVNAWAFNTEAVHPLPLNMPSQVSNQIYGRQLQYQAEASLQSGPPSVTLAGSELKRKLSLDDDASGGESADEAEGYCETSEVNDGDDEARARVSTSKTKIPRNGVNVLRREVGTAACVAGVREQMVKCTHAHCSCKLLADLDDATLLALSTGVQQVVFGPDTLSVGSNAVGNGRRLQFAGFMCVETSSEPNVPGFKLSGARFQRFLNKFVLEESLAFDQVAFDALVKKSGISRNADLSWILCRWCFASLARFHHSTVRKAVRCVELSQPVQRSHGVHDHAKCRGVEKFLRQHCDPEADRQTSERPIIAEPIPGGRPFLRLMFDTYAAVFSFMVVWWSVAEYGEPPKFSTVATVLACLGCSRSHRARVIAKNSFYRGIQKINGLWLKLRTYDKDKFKECAICMQLRATRDNWSIGSTQYCKYHAELEEHRAWFFRERGALDEWKRKAQTAGSGVLLVLMDGMSQFSTRVPYMARLDFGNAAHGQHLIGAVVYCAAGIFTDDIRTSIKFAFLLYDHLTGVGGDATAELLMRLLKILRSKLSNPEMWPNVLVIVVDGASDNKYVFFFTFLIMSIKCLRAHLPGIGHSWRCARSW